MISQAVIITVAVVLTVWRVYDCIIRYLEYRKASAVLMVILIVMIMMIMSCR